jgi:tRNA dimethylallyltransferase
MLTILGPTATGKTTVAAHFAARVGGEVISGDSRQVYCGMDIGTGKDLSEYTVGNVHVPYHLIDIVAAGSKYNVYEYCRDFRNAYADISSRGKCAVLCGGSGLYIDAAVSGYALPQVNEDPALREALEQQTTTQLVDTLQVMNPDHNIDIQNRRRLIRAIEVATHEKMNAAAQETPPSAPPDNVYVGIHYERAARRRRITERLQQRLAGGMIEEVQRLMTEGVSAQMLYYYGLEYRYVAEYLAGKLARDEMVDRLNIAIHQFAKRQMTWFRGMERRGAVIHWIDGALPLEEKLEMIDRIFSHNAADAATNGSRR